VQHQTIVVYLICGVGSYFSWPCGCFYVHNICFVIIRQLAFWRCAYICVCVLS